MVILLAAAGLAFFDLLFLHTKAVWMIFPLICLISSFFWLREKNEKLSYDQRGILYKRGKLIIAAVTWDKVLRVYKKPGPFNRNWEHISYYVCIDYLDGDKKRSLAFHQPGYYGTDEFYEFALNKMDSMDNL